MRLFLLILSCLCAGCALESKFTIGYTDHRGISYNLALTGQNK